MLPWLTRSGRCDELYHDSLCPKPLFDLSDEFQWRVTLIVRIDSPFTERNEELLRMCPVFPFTVEALHSPRAVRSNKGLAISKLKRSDWLPVTLVHTHTASYSRRLATFFGLRATQCGWCTYGMRCTGRSALEQQQESPCFVFRCERAADRHSTYDCQPTLLTTNFGTPIQPSIHSLSIIRRAILSIASSTEL